MSEIFAIFVEPFQFAFMQNALLTALVVAVICALLSCYLVLKGWSLMGDAISHAVLPGIVLAFFSWYSISHWSLCLRYCLCLRCRLFKREQQNQRRYRDGDCIFGDVCHWVGAVH